MRVDVLTLFPGMFAGVLGQSILGRAAERGLVDFQLTDLRDFAVDRHRTVDDRPFGGGPGMVLKVDTVVTAVREIVRRGEAEAGELGTVARPAVILTTPQGRRFDQGLASELAREKWLLIIAGHYEGYDERIRTMLQPLEVSIGDYVLTGGELPAMVMMDAVARLLPGVLGAEDAHEAESFVEGLLEYPQYTRPIDFEGHGVPEVLRSGDHARIAAWREAQALARTRERRPDLLRPDASRKIND